MSKQTVKELKALRVGADAAAAAAPLLARPAPPRPPPPDHACRVIPHMQYPRLFSQLTLCGCGGQGESLVPLYMRRSVCLSLTDIIRRGEHYSHVPGVWFCTDFCFNDPTCYRLVTDEFLVGAASEEEAVAYALDESAVTVPGLGRNASAVVKRARNVMAVVVLPADLSPSSRRVSYTIRVNSTDIPTGNLGNKWAQEKFVKWVVGESEAGGVLTTTTGTQNGTRLHLHGGRA